MRISDWSSDVCSSDLHGGREGGEALRRAGHPGADQGGPAPEGPHPGAQLAAVRAAGRQGVLDADLQAGQDGQQIAPERRSPWIIPSPARRSAASPSFPMARGSAEHKSELQSLIRISSAVSCFKKKNDN